MIEIKESRYSNEHVNIIVVGCGGTGSQLLPLLCQLLSNLSNRKRVTLTLADGDDFEYKNCINQKCLPDEVGMNKAEALAERLGFIYEDLKIKFIDDYIRTAKQLNSVFKKYDLNIIVSCVDNNSTRKLLNDYFNMTVNWGEKLIYIDSGNGDKDRVGQVITGYTEGKNVLSKPAAAYFPEIMDDDEDLSKMQSCTRVSSEHPQNIATNVMAASIVFSVLTNILMYRKVEKGIIYFDVDKHFMVSR